MESLNSQFGINDYTTMHFGASLFDLREFDIDIDMISYVYDSLEHINPGHMPDIFAGTLWMTGYVQRDFSWRQRTKIFSRCYECLGKDGFVHPDITKHLFYHMRWFQNDRIIHDTSYMNLHLYESGVLEKTWTVDPISVRYYAKLTGTKDSPDYLYVLGGSPELFNNFNP